MVANLTGTFFNVVQEPLDVGDTFTVNYTIANTGTTASGFFVTDFRLSTNDFITTFDESLGSNLVGSIAAGSSTTLSRNFTLPGGTDSFWDTFDADGEYAVGMRIDSTNLVNESNEGDNSNVGEFDDYDTLDIDDAYENNNTRLTAYDIGNRETDPLSDILGLGHSFNDDWYEIDITPGFQRLEVDLTHTHSQGNLNLGVYDAAGTLIHSSTSLTNNESIDTLLANGGTHYLRVYNPGADTGQSYDLEWDDLFGTGTVNLVGTFFNVRPEPQDVGNTFTVDFTIANTGTAASGAFTTDFRLSSNDFITTFDESLGTVAHGSIAAGSSVTLTRNFTLPDGTDPFWDTFDPDGRYAVGMRINSTDVVSETNENDNSNVGEFDDYDTLDIDDAYEDNNTRLTAYDIGNNETDPLSDILGLGHSFNDDWYEINVTPGFQRLEVDLTHTHSQGNLNLGVYDAAGTLIHSSTSLTNNESIDTLLANGGTHYLRVYNPGADTGQSYDLEWDDLFGTGTVNLVGTFFNVRPEPQDVGNTFTVDFTIANTGTAASGAFTTDFRLSSNDFITTFDESLGTVAHGSIAAGSSVTLTRNFTLPDGTDPFWDTYDPDGRYAVGMRINSTNVVSETNENDNSNVGEFDDYDTLDIDDAYEDNNTRLTAYNISNNETDPLSDILGLGHSFNDDWYEINISNNYQRLVVDLTHTHSDGNLNLAVYNGAGAFVASSTSATNNESIDTLLANSGTHYLRVYNPGADTGQSYDLEWDDLFGSPGSLTDSAVLIA